MPWRVDKVRAAPPLTSTALQGAAPMVAALVVAACLILVNAGTLLAVMARAAGDAGSDSGDALWAGVALSAADWAAIRFTLLQAALSALLSVLLAVPVARALSRRRFAGRGALITLMGAPFILPTLVAVVGLLAVFGRNGLFNDALAALGLSRISIYGLPGVLLAHVFFNMPLVTRLLLQGWARIPAEQLRLSEAMGFGAWARFRHIEAPMLAQVVPGAFTVVFLICLTSFAVALTLGGGPAATTVELAIYQAFRFDFDLGRASVLALIQTALGLGALALLALSPLPRGAAPTLNRVAPAPPGGVARAVDAMAITLAAVFLLVPLSLVVIRGAPHVLDLPPSVWTALGQSLLVAGASVLVLAGMASVLTLAALRSRWAETVGVSALVASPLVIGTGAFIVLFPLVDPARVVVPVVALVNAAMALPFALRAMIPAARRAEADYARLSLALGLRGRDHVRLILWPALRKPMGFALGLGAALSLGDLGVVVLFAQVEGETLPLALQRLMGAYRADDAAGAALVLLMVALAGFVLCDRLIGGRRVAD